MDDYDGFWVEGKDSGTERSFWGGEARGFGGGLGFGLYSGNGSGDGYGFGYIDGNGMSYPVTKFKEDINV